MEVLVLTGIPGSGKTTLAKEWVDVDPLHRIRINMDDIRFMMGCKFSRPREAVVKAGLHSMFNVALLNDFSVVIDNTNLRVKDIEHYLNLAKIHNYKFMLKVMDTPYETCCYRNSKRDSKTRVPDDTMENMWNKFVGLDIKHLKEYMI